VSCDVTDANFNSITQSVQLILSKENNMTKTPATATRRILNALKSGYDFTPSQLRNRIGITNVSARISELRQAGFPVYLNKKTTSSGDMINVYRLGTASRQDVATARVVADLAKAGVSFVSLREIAAITNDRLSATV
jgi:cell division septation protein DedD